MPPARISPFVPDEAKAAQVLSEKAAQGPDPLQQRVPRGQSPRWLGRKWVTCGVFTGHQAWGGRQPVGTLRNSPRGTQTSPRPPWSGCPGTGPLRVSEVSRA